MAQKIIHQWPRARVFLGTWRRRGKNETIPHIIIARSEAEAVATSEAGMRSALGAGYRYWKLESIRRGSLPAGTSSCN